MQASIADRTMAIAPSSLTVPSNRLCCALRVVRCALRAAAFEMLPSSSHAAAAYGEFTSLALHHLEPLPHFSIAGIGDGAATKDSQATAATVAPRSRKRFRLEGETRQTSLHGRSRPESELTEPDTLGEAAHTAPSFDSVQLRFHLFDHQYTIHMHKVESFHADVKVSASSTASSAASSAAHDAVPNLSRTYTASWADGGWIVATWLSGDGRGTNDGGGFHATMFVPALNELVQIDPLRTHKDEMHPDEFDRLHTTLQHAHQQAQRGETETMVAFRHSDMKDRAESQQCGVSHDDAEHEKEEVADSAAAAAAADAAAHSPNITLNSTTNTVRRRRLLQTEAGAFPSSAWPSGSSFPGGVSRWADCYPGGDTSSYRLSLGIAVDVGFYRLFPSRSDLLQYVSQQVATVNRILGAQLGIQVVVGELLVMDAPGTWAWNHQPVGSAKVSGTVCGADVTITSVLDEFTAWRRDERPGQQAVWHLFTNCFPPPGTVGLSWMTALCRNDIGAGVSSFSSTLWLTFVHELGHAFGGAHTFQLGQGATGGIMDYADGSYPLGSSIYQFNTLYSRTDVCAGLTTAWKASVQAPTAFAPFCLETSSTFTARCGNGLVETGEQCDDDTGCCDLRTCLLVSGKQCSPGQQGGASIDGNTACCQNCLFAPSTTRCNTHTNSSTSGFLTNSEGYCSNGLCAVSGCGGDYYGQLVFCGVRADNPCRQACSIVSQGAGATCSDAFSTPNMNLPLGTLCKAYPHSTCQVRSGTGTTSVPAIMECVQTVANTSSSTNTTARYSWVTGPWSACLGDCGTGVLSRSISCIDANTGLSVGNTSSSSFSSTPPCPLGSQPNSTASCTLTACPSYAYSIPAWSPCDTDCGWGTQVGSPRCLNAAAVASVQPLPQASSSAAMVVPSHFCADLGLIVPNATRTCLGVSGPTCPLRWTYTDYAACTATCGGGVALCVQTCVQTRNDVVSTMADEDCILAGIAPTQPLSRTCNTNACPAYYFAYGNWTQCSASCAGGTQTRTATCIESDIGVASADVSLVLRARAVIL